MMDESVWIPSTGLRTLCLRRRGGSIFMIFPSMPGPEMADPTSQSDVWAARSVSQTFSTGAPTSVVVSMKRLGIEESFLGTVSEEQPQRAGDDHAVGDVDGGALEEDEIVDRVSVHDAVEEVAA